MMAHESSGRHGYEYVDPQMLMRNPASVTSKLDDTPKPAMRMGHVSSGRDGHSQAKVGVHTTPPQPLRHKGVSCDYCNKTLTSRIRYKCSTCPDFDICEICIDDVEHSAAHNPSHTFLRISRPTDSLKENPPLFSDRTHWVHDAVCQTCSVEPIVGFRYFCTCCAISLCETCEQLGSHEVSHSMLKMPPPIIVHSVQNSKK